MKINEQEKKDLEKKIGDIVINFLNLKFIRPGEEQKEEPDLIYNSIKETVGLEITTAYLNNTYAKNKRDIRTNGWPKNQKAVDLTGGVVKFKYLDSEKREIERLVSKHLKKYKGCDRYILVVYDDTLFFDEQKLEEIKNNYSIEIKKYFDEAYLLKQKNATFSLHNLIK